MTVDEVRRLFNFIEALGYKDFIPTRKTAQATKVATDLKVMAWTAALSDIDYKQGQAAVLYMSKRLKYTPMPADICEAVESIKELDNISAEEAWIEVSKQANFYAEPHYSTEEIKKAVHVIGFRNICCSENPGIERAQFLKVYKSIMERKRTEEVTGSVMAALEDLDNYKALMSTRKLLKDGERVSV